MYEKEERTIQEMLYSTVPKRVLFDCCPYWVSVHILWYLLLDPKESDARKGAFYLCQWHGQFIGCKYVFTSLLA